MNVMRILLSTRKILNGINMRSLQQKRNELNCECQNNECELSNILVCFLLGNLIPIRVGCVCFKIRSTSKTRVQQSCALPCDMSK